MLKSRRLGYSSRTSPQSVPLLIASRIGGGLSAAIRDLFILRTKLTNFRIGLTFLRIWLKNCRNTCILINSTKTKKSRILSKSSRKSLSRACQRVNKSDYQSAKTINHWLRASIIVPWKYWRTRRCNHWSHHWHWCLNAIREMVQAALIPTIASLWLHWTQR
jgi:hypothetical protein